MNDISQTIKDYQASGKKSAFEHLYRQRQEIDEGIHLVYFLSFRDFLHEMAPLAKAAGIYYFTLDFYRENNHDEWQYYLRNEKKEKVEDYLTIYAEIFDCFNDILFSTRFNYSLFSDEYWHSNDTFSFDEIEKLQKILLNDKLQKTLAFINLEQVIPGKSQKKSTIKI